MTKDVIYIDVEDDITAIIGKIKSSREKIVAIVPPKRVGVLQSAVNLRLLARTAENGHKHLVIITNNQTLMALSAAAKIPVAKNLQSKPEIAEIAAIEIDEDEDIIDGAQLPVGDLEKISPAKSTSDDSNVEEVIQAIDVESNVPKTPLKSVTKNAVKVPDFSNFRKFLFFGVLFGAAFVGFLIWAIWFSASAKIIITAKTSPAPVSVALKLSDKETTDIKKGIIQTVSKQIKRDAVVEFTATGKDMVGDKARGIITLTNSLNSEPVTVSAGTIFSNGDYDFATVTAAEVPGAALVNGEVVEGTVDVNVAAVDVGDKYNLAAGGYTSSVASITAYGGAMTGGSSREVKVVTASDIQKASQTLVDLNTDDIKTELTEQFINGEVVIGNSFVVARAAAVSSPLLGAEAATGKAKLTSSTTYTISAVAKSEIQVYLKDAVSKQITDINTQKIYDDGIDGAVFSGYVKTDKSTTVNLATVGKIGPNIDQAVIKEMVKGKRYGDIQALLGNISGVNDVDIKFSYFWVMTVPDDNNKIEVEFKLENA